MKTSAKSSCQTNVRFCSSLNARERRSPSRRESKGAVASEIQSGTILFRLFCSHDFIPLGFVLENLKLV